MFKISDQTLTINGEVTFETIISLLHDLPQVLRNPIRQVDLKAVKRCDSAALLLLVAITRQMTLQQRTVRFVHLPPELIKLVQLSNVDEVCQCDLQ